jgi:glyoxylase-like metal-dependent hydrolase (beta-lactamase superfamily II)
MTERADLAPGLVRLRAANPSPLTGTGTNTYLVGATEIAVIDPGPDLDDHLAAILDTLAGRTVTCILVTHAHRDHSALAPRLAARTGAEVLAFGRALDGISPRMAALQGTLPSTGEGLDLAFTPDRRLVDDECVVGPDWTLQLLHTPGHLGSHACLALGDILFSGDHVMGWATSIVSPPEGDMSAYMASLHRLAGPKWRRLLPGHGDPVETPAARIAELVAHRQHREAQILDALAAGPATAAALTARIYRDIPQSLWPAAERNVLAHLIDLEVRMRVAAVPALSPAAAFHLR